MKTVKILSLTLLMSVFCVGMTFAQQQVQQGQKVKATPEERAAKQVDMMKQSLNLTPDQVTKLQTVQTQFNKDQAQARATKNGAPEDMKAKKDAYNAQVKSILTPEQYQKYQDMRANKVKKGDKQCTTNKTGIHHGNGNKKKAPVQKQAE